MSLISSFSLVLDVLEDIGENDTTEHMFELISLLRHMPCFDFSFLLHLMISVLGITNDLSQALQRKDDMVNVMALAEVSKQRLQKMREAGWVILFDEVCSFCSKHDIINPKLEDKFKDLPRRKDRVKEITNLHRYQDEVFCVVIDSQLQELNNHFNNVNADFLCHVLIRAIHSLPLIRRD